MSRATGTEIDRDFRISFVDPEGEGIFRGGHPAVSYDTASGEHLAGGHANHHLPAVRVMETQVFARLVSRESGAARALRPGR